MLALVTPPASLPVSVAEAKRHLRVVTTLDDDLIAALVAAATGRVQTVTGRQLIQCTYELSLNQTPSGSVLYLPRPPLASVTAITYLDTAGVEQTWSSSNYQVRDADPVTNSSPDGFVGPGYIVPAPGVSWPSTITDTIRVFRVQFVAGYGTSGATVPAALKHAILLLVGAWHEQTEDVGHITTSAALALMTPYKVFTCAQAD